MSPLSTLIVEDHPLLAEALVELLRRESEFDVIGTESTVTGALATIAEKLPAFIVLDQHLPDGRGTDIARALRRDRRSAIVVMLTGDASDETFLSAIEVGVVGFVSKARPAATIVELLKRAAGGEIVIATADLARLLAHQRQREQECNERERLGRSLTSRDREVLALMAQGQDTRAIATRTGLAVNTVRGHVQSVIEKLEVHSRLEAVIVASALGLVRLGEGPPLQV